jgi:hypothetical protein
MATTVNTTNFDNALKRMYPDGWETLWYPESPIVAWMPKSYNFTGDAKQVNTLTGGSQTGATLAVALANKSAPTHQKFVVTRAKLYATGSIENEVVAASKGKPAAIAEAMKTAIDSANYGFGRSAAFQVCGDGTGTRGIVSSYAAGVITLATATDDIKFEIGDVLEKQTTAGVLLAGKMTVTAVGVGTITVTLSGGAADPAATDEIARDGDYTNGVLQGIFAWCPTSAPGATAFFGVDRTVHLPRLSGIRIAGGGKSIEEQVFDAQAAAARNGARVDTLWLHPNRYSTLCKSLQSQAFYGQGTPTQVMSSKGRSGNTNVGFAGIQFAGTRGPITISSDPNMPEAVGLMTRKAAWELASLGGMPHFADEAGSRFRQESQSDSLEFRLKAYWNLICKRPLDNVIMNLDS